MSALVRFVALTFQFWALTLQFWALTFQFWALTCSFRENFGADIIAFVAEVNFLVMCFGRH